MSNANTLTFSQIAFVPFRLALNRRIIFAFLSVAVISLIAICVFQLNAYTKEVYLVQDYQNRLKSLSQDQKSLEVDFSRANSLKNIDSYVQGFEKVDKVEYVRVLETTALAK